MTEPAFDMSTIVALYKEDARQSVKGMADAWAQWSQVSDGGQARQALRKLSHQLRGSGKTYGFSQVTRVSKAIENIMIKLDNKTLMADENVRLSVKRKLDRLAAAFKD